MPTTFDPVRGEGTIIAEATPSGRGGVSILRISGPDAIEFASRFVSLFSGKELRDASPGRLVRADFSTADGPIDSGLVVVFRSPRSYTGEDAVELHTHGNPMIVRALFSRALEVGALAALPGEFSRRALLNGRLDFAEAEALSQLLAAEDARVARVAAAQLGGSMSRRLSTIRSLVLDLLARLETELDFVEEGYAAVPMQDIRSTLDAVADLVESLRAAARTLRARRTGLRVGLFGRPNAGKSRLFNALVGYNRALVAPDPGTTRDYIGEEVLFGDLRIQLVDTAGIRDASGLEGQGIAVGRRLVQEIDLPLWLVDSSLSSTEWSSSLAERNSLWRMAPALASFPVVFTKIDLLAPPSSLESDRLNVLPAIGDSPRYSVSSLDPHSVRNLLSAVVAAADGGSSVDISDVLVTDRQIPLVDQISASLASVRLFLDSSSRGSDSGHPVSFDAELLSYEIRALLAPLASLTGGVSNEEVLDRLFTGFCIGK